MTNAETIAKWENDPIQFISGALRDFHRSMSGTTAGAGC